MKLKLKYIISVVSVTIGCWIIYATALFPLGIIFFVLPSFISGRAKLNNPIKVKLPKWNAKGFFKGTSIILGITIFIIIFAQIPKEKGTELLKKWYFIGPFWLLMLSAQSYGYLKDKEHAQRDRTPHC